MEIAIVLVVIGLIISGGLLGISPVLQANKVTQTNAEMDKIDQALLTYVIQNGCLPCPADPATLTGKFEYGTACSGTGTACAHPHGLVPWANIGLSRDDVTDPYGSFIDYAVTTSITDSASLTSLSTSMVRTPPSTYPAGSLTVEDTTGTQQTTAAAYVLISHGPDRSSGYAASNGTLQTDPNASIPQACNTSAKSSNGGAVTCGAPVTGNAYVEDTAKSEAAGAGSYFDDIVRFKTAPVIIQSCGSDACGNPA